MKPLPLRVVWVGFHTEGIPALRAVLDAGVPVAGLLTLRDDALARRSAAGDYAAALRGHDVPVFRVGTINDADALAILRRLQPDVMFVIGWSQILGAEALAVPRLGTVGAHASALPHNRGSAPINWALIRGEATAGNTLMWLNESVDEGRIIDQTRFPITPYDTCATLYDHVAESNRDMILRLLDRLAAGERPARPQATTDEPLLPRRRPEDGAVDWTLGPREVYDFVRALDRPYPGAFSYLDGTLWKIWRCAALPTEQTLGTAGANLGPVYSPDEGACGQLVACGAGGIIVLQTEAPDGTILSGRRLSDQPWNGRIWAQRVTVTA
jgi:methionyl-tRNA formyltransferase